MKLTTKSEYSLLALIFMARHNDRYVKAAEICGEYDMPKKYLGSLLDILKKNGFLKAMRGSEGGYRLAKQPRSISAAMIIRLMDGALASTESVSVHFYSETPLQKERKVTDLLRMIRDYTAQILEGTSLEDLV